MRIPENINRGTITGNKGKAAIPQFLFTLFVKFKKEEREGILPEFLPLFIKGGFGRSAGGSTKIAVKFLFDGVCFHREKHKKEMLESQLTVAGEIPARTTCIFGGICGQVTN